MNPYSSDSLLDQKRMDEILADPVQKANYDTAVAFLKENARPHEVESLLRGIDFRQEVEVVDVKEGQILQRSGSMEKKNELSPDGCFFTNPGASEKDLGLVDFGTDIKSGKDKNFFEATRDFQALKCTTSNFAQPTDNDFNKAGLLYKGGETQYFVPWKETHPIEKDGQAATPALERFVSNQRTPDRSYPPSNAEPQEKSPMFQNKEEEQRRREAMEANSQTPAAGNSGQNDEKPPRDELQDQAFGKDQSEIRNQTTEQEKSQLTAKVDEQSQKSPGENGQSNEKPDQNPLKDASFGEQSKQTMKEASAAEIGAMRDKADAQQAAIEQAQKPEANQAAQQQERKSGTPTMAEIVKAYQEQKLQQQQQEQQKKQEQSISR